jgi:KDO2-lipid IV(A) lauroyltransferase
MAKERNRTADFLIYLVLRLFVGILRALPFATACRIACGLAWVARQVDRRHRLVARENLQHAFPGRYSPVELDRLVARVYQHFFLMIAEIVHLSRLVHRNTWRRYFGYATPEDGRRCIDALTCGRSILIVTAHFGNWEVSSYVTGVLGFKLHAIARPIDNPHIDAWLRRWREESGQKMLAKKGDFDQIEEVLKTGQALGTLGDQDAGARGLFVNYFNRPASTHKAVALLAIEHNVPMLVIGCARVGGPMCFRVYVEDFIEPEAYASRPDAVRVITERFTSSIERLVCRHPEQYFWLHRRWKHQPPVKKARAA